jgi:hypothetical protein
MNKQTAKSKNIVNQTTSANLDAVSFLQHFVNAENQRQTTYYIQSKRTQRFWWLHEQTEKSEQYLWDAETQLLWYLLPPDHAALGQDFRTLVKSPADWGADAGGHHSENGIEYPLPQGWHIANAQRTKEIAFHAIFDTDYFVSVTGERFRTARGVDPGGFVDGNCIASNAKGFCTRNSYSSVLLERDGVESLPLYNKSLKQAQAAYQEPKVGAPFDILKWQLPDEQSLMHIVSVFEFGVRLQTLLTRDSIIQRIGAGKGEIADVDPNAPSSVFSLFLAKRNLSSDTPETPTQWKVSKTDNYTMPHVLVCSSVWRDDAAETIVRDLQTHGLALSAVASEVVITTADTRFLLKDLDYTPVRLPPLDEAQFTDHNKGMWELWGTSESELSAVGIVARDPARDVKDWNVAIDFGTSSTVVAFDHNGKPELFRIGVRDFSEIPKPSHYENPTVLEFINHPVFLAAWQNEAYRPGVNWNSVRCSHEAQHNFRNNESNPHVVSSILLKIKQWALRKSEDTRVRIIDQQTEHEFELTPLAINNPVRGQALIVSAVDSFDPIELYAWFLGMTINWRIRGIFLKYYMTFPVAYPREVKEAILASFRRGLQRSLPVTLITQAVFNDEFVVEERASEPAAYAAIAVKQLDIAPSAEGVAYAVFDFGGGTTDFDYGYYRTPTPEEEDADGIEEVFEHFAPDGDKFLGGENLLENLAYLVFRKNIDECRSKKIAFTRPLDAEDFAGSELFLDKTQAASTNTVMLMARLRSFWEGDLSSSNQNTIEKIDLISRDGIKKSCDFTIPYDELDIYLQDRIKKGITNFFISMKAAFSDHMPALVHVLLAGNASRSRWVAAFFGLDAVEETDSLQPFKMQVFGEVPIKLVIHPPLAADETDVYKPTAKTGVALGLLRLCPGTAVKVTNLSVDEAQGQAPFNHHVGRMRLGKLQVALKRGSGYHEWHELSPIRERVAYLYHTQSPRAATGEMVEGDNELIKMRIDLAGDKPGCKVFVRAISPNQIESCSAQSLDAISQGELENKRVISLI